MLQIKFDQESKAYRPGAVLSGTISWELKKPPRSLDAVLYWYTTGKGDEDQGEAVQQSWKPQQETGAVQFSWQLPRGPISLDGTLINIHWKLEVTIPGSNAKATRDIVLSHLERSSISNTL